MITSVAVRVIELFNKSRPFEVERESNLSVCSDVVLHPPVCALPVPSPCKVSLRKRCCFVLPYKLTTR